MEIVYTFPPIFKFTALCCAVHQNYTSYIMWLANWFPEAHRKFNFWCQKVAAQLVGLMPLPPPWNVTKLTFCTCVKNIKSKQELSWFPHRCTHQSFFIKYTISCVRDVNPNMIQKRKDLTMNVKPCYSLKTIALEGNQTKGDLVQLFAKLESWIGMCYSQGA